MLRPLAGGLVLCVGLVSACGGGKITREPIAATAAGYVPADRIRVMLAPPGATDEESARIVSARIVQALQQTHGDVALIASSDQSAALAEARAAKASFLVSPVILEWTDSHAPPLTVDRIKLRLDLRDVQSGEVVSAVMFENQSSLFAVLDTRPEALLDGSFDRAVTMLMTTGSPGAGTVRQPGPTALEHVPVNEQKYPRQ